MDRKLQFEFTFVVQVEFAKSIGEIDLSNLTDDFVEDVMLQSKPLQSILHAIRKRQRVSSLLTCKHCKGERNRKMESSLS